MGISKRIHLHETEGGTVTGYETEFLQMKSTDKDAWEKLKRGDYSSCLKIASDRSKYEIEGFPSWLKDLVEKGRRRVAEISDYAQPSLYQPASAIASPDVVPSTLILIPLFAAGYYLARRFLKPRTESKSIQELKEVVIEHTD